ncbi:MAG: hypothetical protein IJQ13_04660 [Prevotella sp.]|nr:hypothetical protein [Prevotella sp.]
MTSNQKEVTQYACAVFSLVSGIALCYINFLMQGDVTNGVLGMTGMCMSFSGAVFGVSIWMRGKVAEIETYVDKKIDRMERKKFHEEDQ